MISFRTTTDSLLLFSFIIVACAIVLLIPGTYLPASLPIDQQIATLLNDTLFIRTQAAVLVVSVDSGDTLFERNSKLLFHPASNTKLFTTAAALAMLEEDYTFNTVLSVDGNVQDTALIGDIYLKGYGDPLLDSEDLANIAGQLASRGIKLIKGDVVGDVSYFDDLYWGNGWMWDDEPGPEWGFLTPLSVNHNAITVFVSPGKRMNDPVRIRRQPPTRYVEILNEGKTVRGRAIDKLRVTRLWRERLNVIHITGDLPRWEREKEFTFSVWRPELYTLTLLKEEMERRGTHVTGDIRIEVVPETAEEIFRIERPIDSVLVYLHKESDNLSAENTLKALGAEFRGLPGTSQDGIYVIRKFLASLGSDTTRFHIVDGSGVSRYNLVSAETIIKLLLAMASEKDLFERFFASLPIAGVDGTLKDRMRGSAAQGNARAKTGIIGGVTTLSGYVTTRDDELLAFSILMQNFLGEARPYRDVQDRIVAMLANYSRDD